MHPSGRKGCLYGVKPRLEIREGAPQFRCTHHLDLICRAALVRDPYAGWCARGSQEDSWRLLGIGSFL
jgi:hypothetical protein